MARGNCVPDSLIFPLGIGNSGWGDAIAVVGRELRLREFNRGGHGAEVGSMLSLRASAHRVGSRSAAVGVGCVMRTTFTLSAGISSYHRGGSVLLIAICGSIFSPMVLAVVALAASDTIFGSVLIPTKLAAVPRVLLKDGI